MRHQRGTSILEGVVVLSIVIVVVTLAVSTWQGFLRDRRIIQAATEIEGVLRFARQSAVANSVDACRYRVVVSASELRARAYAVVREDATGTCASPEVTTLVRTSDQFPTGVLVSNATVEFTSEGRLSGAVAASISVSASDRVRYVRVEAATGRVTVDVSP